MGCHTKRKIRIKKKSKNIKINLGETNWEQYTVCKIKLAFLIQLP